jgi:hypothetical protein
MLCDKYKGALIEAASSGATLAGSIAEHMSLCANCRETFAAAQSMFALVDAGLCSRANVAVPGNFDDRVGAALQGEAAQDRKGYSAVLGFGSLAAAAAMLVTILLTQNVKYGGKETAGNSVAENQLPASPHRPVVTGRAKRLGPGSPRKVYDRVNALRVSRESKRHDEPEVLVPQGQEELLVKYMEGMATRKARVTFSADLRHEPDMKPVEVPAIEISELVVKPLSDLSSN